ncbi:MAG: hypothetical protein PUC79_10240 [Prevotellaceae bacterium]|nr:hypothetical protein [Prevotellaceae bacterium]
MEKNNYNITSYSTNDHMVFADKFLGLIFERGGVIIINKDFSLEKSAQKVLYADVFGDIWGRDDDDDDRWFVQERYDYIGKVGDVIVPYKLGAAISANLKSNSNDFESVLGSAERFFKIDWDKAEDTVKLRIDFFANGPNNFRIDVDSDFYSFGDLLTFNFEGEDYQCEDKNYGLKKAIIEPLSTYCRILNKPIGLDIDFTNWVDEYSEEEDVIKINNIVNTYRQKYLGQIRDYIRQGVKNELEGDGLPFGKWKKYEKINQDGVVIPLN